MPDIREVNPGTLRLQGARAQADAFKLQMQIARFGASKVGMPPITVYGASDGVLIIYNGVTRATRIAKLAPGTLVPVEVIGRLRRAYFAAPSIGDTLP